MSAESGGYMITKRSFALETDKMGSSGDGVVWQCWSKQLVIKSCRSSLQ